MGKAKPPEAKPQEEKRNGARSDGQMAVEGTGSEARGAGRGGGGGGGGGERAAEEEEEEEERSADPAGKETERKRVRESWREAMGRAEGGRKRMRCPPALTCSATSRTDWTLVP